MHLPFSFIPLRFARKFLPLFSAALALLPALASLRAERIDTELGAGWKFVKTDAGLAASTDAWEPVSVPHTWNALDGQDGKAAEPTLKYGYYRGACWYARALDIPAAWKGKRVFLRFEAASIVARVYLNGALLGEHRGAFTAFCFELTPNLNFGGANELRVQVDNSYTEDIPPLAGDFDMMGGIYRPVHLIATDPVCISPLDFASSGVYLKPKSLAADDAVVEVETIVSNDAAGPATATVHVDFLDAAGQVVATANTSATVPVGASQPVTQTLRLPHPHLWNGRKDPYLYSARVRIEENGAPVDEVTQPLGLRTVAITEDRGFLLNGEPYPIHGVNRHQDRRDQGWALTPANHDEDEKDILDMGATAIRLAHYPQSEYFYGDCDRDGLLLWNELSMVQEVRDTPAFRANAEQQLRELILQRYNHPAVAFIGLYNEIQKDHDNDRVAVPLVQHLVAVIHELAPQCLVVSASDRPQAPFNRVPDHIGFNMYPGWYNKLPDEMTKFIDHDFKYNGNRRFALSEYGAGGNPFQHQEGPLVKPKPGGPFHPEEWQTYVHEQDWRQIRGNPYLWGTFIWQMFDSASDSRNEGGRKGVNDKGMITEDRKVRKDVYYFYKANWNPEPMVYIASRRMTPRKLATTSIQVFSNQPQVELKLNGQALASVTPNAIHVFQWDNVALRPGVNHVEATASADGKTLHDSCDWTLEP